MNNLQAFLLELTALFAGPAIQAGCHTTVTAAVDWQALCYPAVYFNTGSLIDPQCQSSVATTPYDISSHVAAAL